MKKLFLLVTILLFYQLFFFFPANPNEDFQVITKPLKTIDSSDNTYTWLQFRPYSYQLVINFNNRKITAYDIEKNIFFDLATVKNENEEVSMGGFSRDGNNLSVIFHDRTPGREKEVLRILDPLSGKIRRQIPVKNISDAEFSPSGKYLAIDSGFELKVLSPAEGYCLKFHVTGIHEAGMGIIDMDFIGDRYLATAGENEIIIWDLEKGKKIKKYEGGDPMDVTSDGKKLIYFRYTNDSTPVISLIKISNWKSTDLSLTGTNLIRFSPDNRKIIYPYIEKDKASIRVYLLENLKKIMEISGTNTGSFFSSLSLTSDGKFLATSGDRGIHIWELRK